MWMKIERKPTAHKNKCLLCDRVLIKGELTLYAEQAAYPGHNSGRACYKCLIGGALNALNNESKINDTNKKEI